MVNRDKLGRFTSTKKMTKKASSCKKSSKKVSNCKKSSKKALKKSK